MPRSESSPLVPILLICAVIAIGTVAYIKLAPADVVPREVQNEQQTGGEGVHILTPYYANDELKFIYEPAEVPPNEDKYVFAVNRYLRATEFVDKDAVLRKCTIENGTATLDFSPAFHTSYGTTDESTVINGILATMGQFENVSYVRFVVDGELIESLGNLELIDPLPVTRPAQPLKSGSSPRTAKS